MTDAVRRQLYAYQQKGDSGALQAYCENLLNTQTDALLSGCLLWNLSDVYAMRRDAESLYMNHFQFASHLQALPPMYSLWLVGDATQRLTLEQGAFGDAWWQWYSDATATYDPSCEVALFNAHRAAFYKSPQMPCSLSYAEMVDKRFQTFLEHTRHSESSLFYCLVYAAQHLQRFGNADTDILSRCEPFFDVLSATPSKQQYAAGEWQAINTLRSKAWQAQVGITCAVNALIDTGNLPSAKSLYQTACKCGLPANAYIERRLYTCLRDQISLRKGSY